MRQLPPLPAIRAFEAAARHLSFKAAAAELGVTPTAISHQIRLLEDILGTALFIRRTRQVVLTEAGQDLFVPTRDGLDSIAMGVDRLRKTNRRNSLTLSATTAFTSNWLIPRLGDFREHHPSVDVRLHASDDPVSLKAGTVDAAVRYGSGLYDDLDAQLLFTDEFAPLCSPSLAIERAEDLANQTLIHTEWRHPDSKTPNWQRWCKAAGIAMPLGGRSVTFADDTHTAKAVIAGQGIAILSVHMLASEIDDELLKAPFSAVLKGHGHHFVTRTEKAGEPAVAALRSWLLAITASYR
ncbi:LysR substrate-binding domain-containing protein [Kordiimonas sp.]|uniref:LysR substrate-binding domain-containing protein n=1 Tax=Kordiimonas sp. TaxID=1970157 RepID=UPI003A91B890